jgi:hypothetical protein
MNERRKERMGIVRMGAGWVCVFAPSSRVHACTFNAITAHDRDFEFPDGVTGIHVVKLRSQAVHTVHIHIGAGPTL